MNCPQAKASIKAVIGDGSGMSVTPAPQGHVNIYFSQRFWVSPEAEFIESLQKILDTYRYECVNEMTLLHITEVINNQLQDLYVRHLLVPHSPSTDHKLQSLGFMDWDEVHGVPPHIWEQL